MGAGIPWNIQGKGGNYWVQVNPDPPIQSSLAQSPSILFLLRAFAFILSTHNLLSS